MKAILKQRSRSLRMNSTNAERYLWRFLRSRRFKNYKFKRQYVIKPYIVDFVCLWKRLIIELDGAHHAETIAYDLRRTKYLEKKGFRVIRFNNYQFYQDMDEVLMTIRDALNQ